MPSPPTRPFILASGSATRAALLRNARVPFDVVPSDVDEAGLRDEMTAAGRAPGDIAMALAEAKALYVSASHPSALILGADQILTCDGALFAKASSKAGAAEHLARLSGKTHVLWTAAVLASNGASVERIQDHARLTMRILSPAFIAAYLEQAGDVALTNVGAYAIEGPGVQLFSRIDGDYFTILGLPLLAVLAHLRTQGVLPE